MPDPVPQGPASNEVPCPEPPWLGRCLFLDLEVEHSGRIREVGVILGQLERAATASDGLRVLDEFAPWAGLVAGHNIVQHDLPRLAGSRPGHPVLALPAIDTLVLSPLCFPRNPYHRLLKDYKLVRESVNNPVADARLARTLLLDEWESLVQMRGRAPDLFRLLHFLLAGSEDPAGRGFALLFESLGGRMPSSTEAPVLAQDWIRRFACRSAAVPQLDSHDARRALAYAAAWLEVAGESSVLPPWVRRQHPDAARWLRAWRCTPCGDPACSYCRTEHDAVAQLQRWFRFDGFRPIPAAPDGSSLQQRIVEGGLRDESILAILPTGGGKSICFQLPALVRHRRLGCLTVVVSPLQALMKDQVDGLVRRTGIPSAAALYGMLTPPERADVLRRVQFGDIALLYVSPEQFRNRSFRQAIANREIGCWVFDEAHCLSKWGHDFRPDYLYAARFIREFSAAALLPVAPIACFTATAKREVAAEILEHFEKETGQRLRVFEGGVERSNLRFRVEGSGAHAKERQVDEILQERLGPEGRGSAVVFRSRRAATERTARFLRDRGWSCEHFHAGLTPPEKKRIQDDFIAGRIRVICATNAFGMGIDKEDVRLVVHADAPGSLENYLQEAGRAGRDGHAAECVLLFDEEDCESQFRLAALSELRRRDIAQILRGLRKAARGRDEVVVTSGELLRDDEVDTTIDPAAAMADTQVRAAVAWLERAGFLTREENVTSVFEARPLVRTLDEARQLLARKDVQPPIQALWLAILGEIMNAGPTESLTVDQLALLPELRTLLGERPAESMGPAWVSSCVLKALDGMAEAGLLKRDTRLNAFIRHKVQDHSRLRLERVDHLEDRLLETLIEAEPDAGTEPDAWMRLSLARLNQRLVDEGLPASVAQVRQILFSVSQDGRGLADRHGSLDLRSEGHDTVGVRIRRGWENVRELSARRRRAARLLLDRIYANIPPDAPTRIDLLVEFSFESLREALDADLEIRSRSPNLNATVERALLYLHEQQVIELRQGLAIFRSAMTIRIARKRDGGSYTQADYQPLAAHYGERILQVHVMGEYARRGMDQMKEALELVAAYFRLRRDEFVQRYLPMSAAVREHATTASSYERIVTDLENPDQIRIVTAPIDHNLLILAGPGAGKTRTVVHRAAYLLRVHRVRPASVLICCFNRAAALELRRRLNTLAGEDARGVTILTYHSLALRLLGRTVESGADRPDFNLLIRDAVALLRGERTSPGVEADDVRDRLLAGFHHILVDEYQDIDADQYALVAAIAGRTLVDPDQKLSILAVGDDDQSIYRFRGANVEFIRRFQQDYDARVHHLVENHRSTRRIIDAANAVIALNHDRMKSNHPIRIDRHRRDQSPGGVLESIDSLARGRVQVIAVKDPVHQAAAVLAELRRLQAIRPGPWAGFAVLSSEHQDLHLTRAALEKAGIPVRWQADRGMLPRLNRVREIHLFLQRLTQTRHGDVTALQLAGWLDDIAAVDAPPGLEGGAPRPRGSPPADGQPNPWLELLGTLVQAWRDESGDEPTPACSALQFFHETLVELRRESAATDGVVLSTVHAAKGTEYDHVLLIGRWAVPAQAGEAEERRRTFYVGMTRARVSLAVFDQQGIRPSLPCQLTDPGILRRTSDTPDMDPDIRFREYTLLSLEDLHLSYAGQLPASHPIHAHLASLRPGSILTMQLDRMGHPLLTLPDGEPVARLSAKAAQVWSPRMASVHEIRVRAMYRRFSRDGRANADSPDAAHGHRVDEWELPLVEIVWDRG